MKQGWRQSAQIFLLILGFAGMAMGEALAAEYCATYEPGLPLTMAAGETKVIPVKVTNCGTKGWASTDYSSGAIFYRYSLHCPQGCSSPVFSVDAGKSSTVPMTVTASNSLGAYTLDIDVLEYQYPAMSEFPAVIRAFSSLGVPTGKLSITVVPAITKVSSTLAVEPATFKGACPTAAKVHATVTANGRGMVNFHFVGEKKGPTGVLTPATANDLEFTPQKHSITFDGPGTKNVSFELPVRVDFAGSITLETTSPVKTLSNKVSVNFDCIEKGIQIPKEPAPKDLKMPKDTIRRQ